MPPATAAHDREGAGGAPRAYWILLAALCGLNAALLWTVDVLPAQDLPQHLAYVRIFLDYDDPELDYSKLYVLPERFQPYFTTYYLLVFLARMTTVEAAIRLLLTLYVFAVPLAIHFLARSARPGSHPPPWAALLAIQLVWSPSLVMGFLAFTLAVPVFFVACGLVLRWAAPGRGAGAAVGAVVAAALLASLHLVAAGALALFCLIFLVAQPGRRPRLAAVATVVAAALTVFAWSRLGEIGAGSLGDLRFAEAIRTAHGIEFLNQVFRITWYDPLVKINYVLWTLVGPYRWTGQLWVAVGLLAVLAAARFAPGRAMAEPEAAVTRGFRRTTAAFAIAAWLLPWGIEAPSEATFIDFRLFLLAWGLVLAVVPPVRLSALEGRTAVVIAALLMTANFGIRAHGFSREAQPALRLVEAIDDHALLTTLCLHDRSSYFAKQFRLTHFLPMYYTVRHRGMNTQFWGRYIHHLPIDYRTGAPPAHTPDWFPWQFRPEDLRDSDYLLVQYSTGDSSPRLAAVSEALSARIEEWADLLRCEANWCLYRLPGAGGA